MCPRGQPELRGWSGVKRPGQQRSPSSLHTGSPSQDQGNRSLAPVATPSHSSPQMGELAGRLTQACPWRPRSQQKGAHASPLPPPPGGGGGGHRLLRPESHLLHTSWAYWGAHSPERPGCLAMGRETSVSGRTYTSGPFGAPEAGEPCAEKPAAYSSPSAFSNSCSGRWAPGSRGAPGLRGRGQGRAGQGRGRSQGTGQAQKGPSSHLLWTWGWSGLGA